MASQCVSCTVKEALIDYCLFVFFFLKGRMVVIKKDPISRKEVGMGTETRE